MIKKSDQFVTLTNFSSLTSLLANKTEAEHLTQLARNGTQLTPNLDGLSTVFSQAELTDLISIQSI